MTSDDTQQSAANEAVGQQLRRAREKHGLSITQIADAQHLRNGIIQAIEGGDYGQIDSELFLKGYVRAYAKQVGLDSDAIISDLNRELEPARLEKARELEANPLVNIERRRRRKRRIAKLLLLVIAVMLVGALVVVFVIPKFAAQEVGSEQPAATQTEPQPDGEEPAENISIPAVPDSESGGENSDPGQFDEASVVPSSSAELYSEQVETPVPSDQAPAVAEMIEPAVSQPQVSDTPDPATGVLEIAFTGDCWVQIRDASGNRLASSLQRAGDTLEVSGKAPLKVVIGAVSTVDTIHFQGETVDINEFPVVNNRSEFTLTI
ncbi:RodZ domain-containing protein [Marinobacter salexigens]|uniref:RodZ domain-containing protein n=1 Tax=Marinobacter salexigens TaxID=1925763 RepID=UPI000C288964|nr:RodZ domain-containing protein [Marinobacter salexigens]